MKKFIPLMLLGVGILVVIIVFVFVRGRNSKEEVVQEDLSALIEVSLEDSPLASLIPRADGHWLDMTISKLGKFEAYSMDYELLYKLPDGRTQGVPGSVLLKGQENIERELLLGSESSGKFRYDEGVEVGTFSLRFRNEKGKLVAKFSTEFNFQNDEEELTSTDGKLTYLISGKPLGYFVTMNTFGYPDSTPPGDVVPLVYGIFTSSEKLVPGTLKIEGVESYYRWTDDRLDSETVNVTGEMEDVGIFSGLTSTGETSQ